VVERQGHLVEKQALMAALWPDAVVEEANLAYTVSALRKALGNGQEGEQFIQTIPTRGYRFVAPVREVSGPPDPVTARTRRGLVAPVAVALAVGTLIGGVVVWRLVRSSPPLRRVVRFEVPIATSLRHRGPPALSPDGTRVAYMAAGPEGRQVYVRDLDSVSAAALPRSAGAYHPLFSPDGRAIAFFTGSGLTRVDLATGRVTSLCPCTGIPRGATWGTDNRIYFADSGISVVSGDGGAPQHLTKVSANEAGHGWPELLPGGRHLLFTRWDSEILDDGKIEAVSLDNGERRIVMEGGFGARYIPTGHLVYLRSGTLMAVPFDARTLRVSGTPVKVVEGIGFTSDGQPLFAVSPAGTLAYFAGTLIGDRTQMVWMDVPGKSRQELDAPPGFYLDPALSPDARRLALAPMYGTHQDIWVADLTRGGWTRLTVDARASMAPVWRPDDAGSILFSMGRGSAVDLFSVPADASRAPELVYESPYFKFAASSSAAARLVAFTEFRPETKADIWLLDFRGKPVARPFLQTPFWESTPALSPDGAWLAYESDESGRHEIHVRATAGGGGKWQISSAGGERPRWSRDGHRIVYRSGNKMMAAGVTADAAFTFDAPRVLFEGEFEWNGYVTPNYDLTPDGSRFLMTEPFHDPQPAPLRLVVIDNWFAELRQKVAR
jgi:serine/threonine-protein kinase